MIESPLYDEIMEEGRIETTRNHIQKALTLRFGTEAAREFAETLDGIGKQKQLEKLFDLALSARRLTEFRKAVEKIAGK